MRVQVCLEYYDTVQSRKWQAWWFNARQEKGEQSGDNAGLSGVIQGIGLGDVVACCLTMTLIYFLRLYLALLPQLSHQIHLVVSAEHRSAPILYVFLTFHYKQQTMNRKGCRTLLGVGVGGGGSMIYTLVILFCFRQWVLQFKKKHH